ncbi:GCG_CRPN prefix-to-repeats domain-containing protein [Methylobacterium haplocladii]|uniref:Uncharacterized protein n=1 Tax=Methylobacterium haplocladii TaxID=1176176 RepID=A0A512IKT6_9HYPH|nr:hypothetical protein [Methylobacterium haplocladii]GEO98304.1 hypothetical protein MHA02_06920 [Methylobacterium haplocladii]GJD86386.1 hypothetical protein HPGCJGGD_4292 [Methylobacterium haplocladii]GLS58402.1 hypothetical protein GCM10007887_10620 [Methylobacterium haplocladii]
MKFTGLIVAASAMLLAGGTAWAVPLAQAPLAADPAVTLVRGGCGFGAHRGPYGGCRLNNGPRGDIRRALTGAPGGCPPGRYRIRGICRYR